MVEVGVTNQFEQLGGFTQLPSGNQVKVAGTLLVATKVMLFPAQTVTSGGMVSSSESAKLTVTASIAEQPFSSITVSEKVVAWLVKTTGLAMVGLLRAGCPPMLCGDQR